MTDDCLSFRLLHLIRVRVICWTNKMAHISSNCIYLDKQDNEESCRTYQAIEVDKETRRRDCRICLLSIGLASTVLILALLFLRVLNFEWMQDDGIWARTFRYSCYGLLLLVVVIFVFSIAKVGLLSLILIKKLHRFSQLVSNPSFVNRPDYPPKHLHRLMII